MTKILLFLCCLFLFNKTYCQTTYYVAADATGNDNGTNWEDAFSDLQDALAITQAGDTIWVAEGNYYPTNGTDRYVSFHIPSGVRLFGGFAGTEQDLVERELELHPTILSGDIGSTDILDNSVLIAELQDPEEGTLLDGVVFERAWHAPWEPPFAVRD